MSNLAFRGSSVEEIVLTHSADSHETRDLGYIIVEKTIRLLRKNSVKDWLKLRPCQELCETILYFDFRGICRGTDYRLYRFLRVWTHPTRLRLFFKRCCGYYTTSPYKHLACLENERQKVRVRAVHLMLNATARLVSY